MPVSSSTSSAFPRTLSRSASRFSPSKRIHDGSLFETAAIPLCSGPQLCSPPRSSLPLRSNVAEQPRLLRPSTTCVVTSACIGYANHLPRQLVVWGLTPHKIHSLVGCSSVIAILQQLSLPISSSGLNLLLCNLSTRRKNTNPSERFQFLRQSCFA